ncbi:spore germination protein [Paenibacillus sp. H1-7]|uniref:spore germination protein n=1 Tax=Paenibacillus sp. H1-7 TaxID=2282849 RepID=UPI001EF87C6D|nr:spore germination protein [Paenibacillus sp. H1-7]ULL14091.1 spore germination protein [Paenibacillus sp. H1-7]
MGIFRKWLTHRRIHQQQQQQQQPGNDPSPTGGQAQQMPLLSMDLDANVEWIRTRLEASPDLILRHLSHPQRPDLRLALAYIDGLVDTVALQHMIAELFQQIELEAGSPMNAAGFYQSLLNRKLTVGGLREIEDMESLLICMFNGATIVMVQGNRLAISADTIGGEMRGVEEPSTQTVIRGPKEGFTENLRTNTALIRRKIKSPDLRIDTKLIGKQTHTNVAILYLKGVVKNRYVEEVHKRLDAIQIDGILESGYIEELIQDSTFSPFPTIQNTERPDTAAAALLEGQIVIIVDGTPFVLIAPFTFFKFFQSSEDYYQRYDIASFLRIIRFVSFIVAMLLPSLYIATTTFHQEMLPATLLISLAAQREGVPFPALLEAMLMEITFEVLREAGVRMPRVIGSAISIVGALVLGQAAVQAGLVSAAMVIVVSFTAIASFVIPSVNMSAAARLIRFTLMLLAATLGLFGIMSGLMVVLIHLAGLRSFGAPYLAPISPLIPGNLKDIFIRVPWWAMVKRPLFLSQNQNRQPRMHKPSPPDDNNS